MSAEETLRLVLDARAATQNAKAYGEALKKTGESAKKAGTDSEALARSVKKMEAPMAGITKMMGALGIAMTGAFAVHKVISTIAKFEESMSKVRAVTGATTQEMARLTATARTLGATTRFSASEAADGMVFLGQAGFNTTQILEAAGPALALAQAGSLSLAESADIASNVISGLNLEASEFAKVADVMALTASRTNTNVRQMGEALAYVAPVAAATGQSVEQISAAIGTLGNAGIQASMAGTVLRTVIADIVNPTDTARAVFAKMQVNVEDLQKAMSEEGLAGAMRILAEAGLDAEAAFGAFGQRGAAGVLALTSQSGALAQFAEYLGTDAAGAAERMAAIMDDNLVGAFKRLNSAVEELILMTGDTGLAGNLRGLVEGMAGMVRAAAGNQQAMADMGGKLALVESAITAILGLKFAGVITGWIGAFKGVSPAAAAAARSLGSFAAIAVAVGVGLNKLIDWWKANEQAQIDAMVANQEFAKSLQALREDMERGFVNKSNMDSVVKGMEEMQKATDELRIKRDELKKAEEELAKVIGPDRAGMGPAGKKLDEIESEIKANEARLALAERLIDSTNELRVVDFALTDEVEKLADAERSAAEAAAELEKSQLATMNAFFESQKAIQEWREGIKAAFADAIEAANEWNDIAPEPIVSGGSGFVGPPAPQGGGELAPKIQGLWMDTWTRIAQQGADTARAWREGWISSSRAIEETFRNVANGIADALAQAGHEGAGQLVAAIGQVLGNFAAIGDAKPGQSKTQAENAAIGSAIGLGLGAWLGGPAGAALGASLGEAVGSLFKGSRGFAGQNVGLVDGQLAGIGDQRGNKGADFEALNALMTEMLDGVNDIFESLGLELSELGATFDIMYQDSEGIIVNINGVQKAFGDDMNAAISYLATSIAETATFAGMAVEATAAIQQAAAEAAGDLEAFANDIRDIQTILEAGGPIVPAAVARLRDEFEETQRLAEQAERFGLDAAGLWSDLNRNIEAFRDSLDRTAILSSVPTGRGVDAIRDYFENVVRPAVFAFNELMREMGGQEINLGDIDAMQRGAVNAERARIAQEEADALERANRLVQDATRGFEQIAGTLDPTQDALRRLDEELNRAMEAAEKEGIATENLVQAHQDATQAILEQAEANRELERMSKRAETSQFRADVFGFAADVFDKIGEVEKAAEMRAKQEFVLFKMAQAELQLRLETLKAEGRNVALMEQLFNDVIAVTANWTWEDFVKPVVDSANQFHSSVVSAADAMKELVQQDIGPWIELFRQGTAASRSSGIRGDMEQILSGTPSNLSTMGATSFKALISSLNEQFGAGLPSLKFWNLPNGQIAGNRSDIEKAIMQLVEEMQKAQFDKLGEQLRAPFDELEQRLMRDPRGPVSQGDQLANALEQFRALQEAFAGGDAVALEGGADILQELLRAASEAIPNGSAAFAALQAEVFDFIDAVQNADLGGLLQAQAEPTVGDNLLFNQQEQSRTENNERLEHVEGAVDDVRGEIVAMKNEIVTAIRTLRRNGGII